MAGLKDSMPRSNSYTKENSGEDRNYGKPAESYGLTRSSK